MPKLPVALPLPRFGGPLATRTVTDQFIRGGALRDALKQDTDPYVGELPPDLLAQYPGAQREALLEGFNTLAQALREIFPSLSMFSSKGKQSGRVFTPVQVSLGDRKITVSAATVRLLGPGEWAVTYRLDIGNRPYAFKVYYDSEHDDRSFGAYSDLAAGVHLTRNGITRDMMKTYMGNPATGWSLLEYLGPDVSRQVDPQAKTLRDAGFFFPFDQYSEDNYIDGVRIDSGGCYNDQEEQYQHSGYYIDHYMGYLNDRADQVQSAADYAALLKEIDRLENRLAAHKARRFQLPGQTKAEKLAEQLYEARAARWGIWANLGRVGETEADRFAIFQQCMQSPFFRRHFAPDYQHFFQEDAYRRQALDQILAFPDSRRYLFANHPPAESRRRGQNAPWQNLLTTFADCLGVRVGRGEFDQVTEFFKTRYPQLDARLLK